MVDLDTVPLEDEKPTKLEFDPSTPNAVVKTFGGLNIVPVKQITDQWGHCILIYGPGGVGKTPQAASVANSPACKKGLLFLDVEGGVRSISHMDNVDVHQIFKWKDWTTFRRTLTQNPKEFPYDVVVVDNLSELADVSMKDITEDQPSIREWGENTDKILDMVRFCRDASRKWGIIFILIAWDTDLEEGSETAKRTKKSIAFTPKLREKLPGIVDIIGYMNVDLRGTPNAAGDRPRLISFAPARDTVAKFRRSKDENASKVPLEVYDTDITALCDVVTTLTNGSPFPLAKHTPPRAAGGTGAVTRPTPKPAEAD